MKVPNGVDIEKLYQTYYMDVYSYIMTIMKDGEAAEELTQETFFRAMKSKFKGQSSELTWLCAIAKNLCMDVFRKKKLCAVFAFLIGFIIHMLDELSKSVENLFPKQIEESSKTC